MFQWDVFLQVLGNRRVTDRCPVLRARDRMGHGDHLASLTLFGRKPKHEAHAEIAVAAEERWSAYLTDDEPPEVALYVRSAPSGSSSR